MSYTNTRKIILRRISSLEDDNKKYEQILLKAYGLSKSTILDESKEETFDEKAQYVQDKYESVLCFYLQSGTEEFIADLNTVDGALLMLDYPKLKSRYVKRKW